MKRFVVMGVSGCGKTTLGRGLAAQLGLPFVEGDGLHPPANVSKMAAGTALDDADRQPFLENVASALLAHRDSGVVLSCSALKRSYRDLLRARAGDLFFVLPQVDRAELARRLATRTEHFMPAALLDSQLATLEPLQPDEAGIIVNGSLDMTEQIKQVTTPMTASCDIGLIGLAVMGENLALNIESRGYRVCVFNRTVAKTQAFLEGRALGKAFTGAATLPDFVAALSTPRKILMMVKAGTAVDDLIAQLSPLLAPGDILIDGGNSLYTDTIRRTRALELKGLLYVGSGVSGGEEGALTGPSLMPGGSAAAWPQIKPIFQAICARTPADDPCCDWMGADGAGHFVKMIHNGIEYGDMQIISECYDVMKRALHLSNETMSAVFAEWNRGELDSYLVEITRDILAYRDAEGAAVIDSILDTAGQKGTGKWTVVNALEEGMPLTLIGEAVFARCISALKEERVAAATQLAQPAPLAGEPSLVHDLRQALYAAKIVSYAQGYQLMRAAAQTNHWDLNFGGIALTWRGGCIIRSAFLDEIKKAFDRNPVLVNLVLDPFFKAAIESRDAAWRRVIIAAVQAGIPVPCLSAALSWWDAYRSARLPANLLQAQRDYFGAHTYERVDQARGRFFHTNWTGHGGSTTSQAYQG